ncbi:DUF2653 family protein [Paenibacillus sp. J2TS4]|uniref:DUF2653 family protein n=1 Tax=Paenibacillus sp. J2TS4 TaxID=2807194 RepID=UPI001BCD5985
MNALCLHIAELKQAQPTRCKCSLLWDEQLGFSTEVTVEGRARMDIQGQLNERPIDVQR